MHDQGMGDFSGVGWTIGENLLSMDGMFLGWLDVLALDKWFSEEISFKTKRFGCSFEGLEVFRGGRFQSEVFNNKSVNLPPGVRFFAVAKTPPTSAGYLRVRPMRNRMEKSYDFGITVTAAG